MNQYLPFVNELSFFQAFTLEEILAILGILKERKLTNREVLIKQGDRARSCFFLVEGQIRVFIAKGEHSKQLAMLDKGAIFGHKSLIDHGSRGATYAALGDATVLELGWSEFDMMFNANNSAAFKFTDALTRLLVQQLRAITDQFMAMFEKVKELEDPGELDLDSVLDEAAEMTAGFNLDDVEVVVPDGLKKWGRELP